jgi:hypothetical protein
VRETRLISKSPTPVPGFIVSVPATIARAAWVDL